MERDSIEALLQHREWVRRLARSLVRDPAEAADLEQEGWLAAVESPPRRPAAFRSWMRSVLRNRLAARRKREAARRRRERQVARPEPIDDLLGQVELQRELAAAVRELNEPYRTVVLLRYFEGLAPRRIAQRLDVPVETVRTRQKRALDKLRARLARTHPDWKAGLLLLAFPPGRAAAALGALAMSKTQKIAIAAVLAVLLGGWLVMELRSSNADPVRGEPIARTVAPGEPQPGAAGDPESRSEPTWVVRGRTMAGGDQPFPGARVEAKLFAGPEPTGEPVEVASLVSGERGEFVWPVKPPDGMSTLRLRARAEQARPAERTILVNRGSEPPRVTLRLRRLSATVRGSVTDGDGKPLGNARIIGGGSPDGVVTDSSGTFTLDVTDDDDHFIYALAEGFAMQRAIVRMAGREGTLSFELRPEFRIVGRVTDPGGAPVAGARVSTFFTMHGNEARTDSEGRFSLGHLDPGRTFHMLRADHPDWIAARAQVETKGEVVERDLVLGAGVSAAGRITAPDGHPVGGQRVVVASSPNAMGKRRTVTRDDGTFKFDSLAPGEANLYVFARGCAPVIRKVQVPGDFPLELGLVPGRTLSGTVRIEGRGAGAGVHLAARVGGTSLPRRAIADQNGHWILEDLPEGTVDVYIFGRNVLGHTVRGVAVGQSGVEFTVPASVRLRGRVVDAATGTPIDEFTIRFLAVHGHSGGIGASWMREGHRFSDPSGSWDTGEHEQLAVGAVVRVEVRAPGYAPASAELTAGEGPDANTVRIARGSGMSAIVVDAGGAPVAGAQVELVPEAAAAVPFQGTHGKRLARTGKDGNARFAGLAPGRFILTVQHPGYARHHEVVAAEGPVERRIRLIRGGTIHGRASPGDVVDLIAKDKTRSTVAGDDGRFRFTRLPAGDHFLAQRKTVEKGALTSYYRPIVRKVALGENETVEANLESSGSAILRGSVELPDGSIVRLHRAPDLVAPSAVVRDGAFEITGLEAGTYRVVGGALGGTIEIRAGETVTLPRK